MTAPAPPPDATNPTDAQACSQHLRPEPGRLRLVDPRRRGNLGGKVVGVANAGRRLHVGISLPDTRHHLHVVGPTGTGKTSLLLRMILDDAAAGHGVAVFDSSAKSDLVRDILDRLPADCGDRLVVIDPDETQAPPAINLLDPAVGGSPHQRAAHIASVMSKVWSRYWGHRTADIAHHALLTLAHTPGATLAQLPRLLSDTAWRRRRVTAVRRRLGAWEAATLAEFWDGFEELTPGSRASLTAPLLSKLRLVLAQPIAAHLLGVPATTFTLSDILDGGILLVRLPRGIIGDDGGRLIGSLLLAALWQATTARAATPEANRLDAAIYLDEAQHVTHLPIGLDDALAEARGLHTSFVLAHQYMGQLSDEIAQAIDANARNKIYFALAPDDATRLARHVTPYLDADDLARLGGFEVALRPVADGHTIPPVTATTLPPPDPVPGRAEALRAAARRRTGLPEKHRRRLLAEYATAARGPATATDHASAAEKPAIGDRAAVTSDPDVTEYPDAGLVGHNTFTRHHGDAAAPTAATDPTHASHTP